MCSCFYPSWQCSGNSATRGDALNNENGSRADDKHDKYEKIERACEKENAYKNLLESFHDLDEEDKLEEIIKGVFELRDFLEIVNKKYDENNEMLDVLEVTDTDEFSDKLDVIYSYVTSIKEEVAKLFEIANSYSKSFDI